MPNDPTAARPPDECQSCGFEAAKLDDYPAPISHEPLWLCGLCAGTEAGNAARYPAQYDDSGAVLKAICYVGNAILKAVNGT